MIPYWLLLFSPLTANGCIPITDTRIEVRHLAGLLPEWTPAGAGTLVTLAPAMGFRRTIGVDEMARWSRAHNLPQPAWPDPVCIEWPLGRPSSEDLLAAMRAAFNGVPIRIELLEIERRLFPPGRIAFPRSGLQAPVKTSDNSAVTWRGSIEYASKRRVAIWTKVRISAHQSHIVATVPLTRGDPVALNQVREEFVEGYPLPENEKLSLANLEGRAPLRDIPTGTSLHSSDLSRCRLVDRGDVLTVEVRSGAARMSLKAKAEAPGGRGATIPLRNLESGRLLRAVVESKGKATLIVPSAAPSTGDSR